MATQKPTAPDAAQTSDNTADNKADVQAQVDQLLAENIKLAAALKEADTNLVTAVADRDTLAEANEKLTAELEEKTEELTQAEVLIEEQTAKLAAAEVSQSEGAVIVTHEKEQYRVLAPKFNHKSVEVEARSLRTNPDLVRELVESGSGLLQKVEAKA